MKFFEYQAQIMKAISIIFMPRV